MYFLYKRQLNVRIYATRVFFIVFLESVASQSYQFKIVRVVKTREALYCSRKFHKGWPTLYSNTHKYRQYFFRIPLKLIKYYYITIALNKTKRRNKLFDRLNIYFEYNYTQFWVQSHLILYLLAYISLNINVIHRI